MELHLLRKFVVVAEELHFGRAAARLHMAQSPLSQQIRRLEADLGVELLERTTRRVSLTEAGRAFLSEAQATLAQAERAREVATRVAAGRRGYLQLTHVGSAAFHLLPPLLRAFRRAAPEIDLDLRERTSAEQLEALEAGRSRIGLMRSPPLRPGLRSEVLLSEPVLVAMPTDHAQAGQPEIRLASLATEPFILFPRDKGPAFHDLLLDLCRQAGFTPRTMHRTHHMATTVSLVAGGLGVSLVPASVRALRPDDVVYRPVTGSSAAVDLSMVWREDHSDQVLETFLRCARDVATTRCITR